MTTTPFIGLTMPVFNSFGFLSEENTVKFALDQMEQFVRGLHASLSRDTQLLMPYVGLDTETQGVYLARTMETNNDLHLTWHLKPNTMRMAINQTDRSLLNKVFKAIQKNHDAWMSSLGELSDTWELELLQMEYDPDSGEASKYKTLFSDKVSNLDSIESSDLVERMIYLNNEEKWLVTIQLTNKVSSDFVSAMEAQVSTHIAKQIDDMLPLLRLLSGGAKSTGRKLKTSKDRTASTKNQEKTHKYTDEFTFKTQLKPLHIRKGFINMTPEQWPFFQINSRTTVREITLGYDENEDKDSTVWRLVPDDKARIMLSDKAHRWLEDNFGPNDEIQIHATKLNQDIKIELALVYPE